MTTTSLNEALNTLTKEELRSILSVLDSSVEDLPELLKLSAPIKELYSYINRPEYSYIDTFNLMRAELEIEAIRRFKLGMT